MHDNLRLAVACIVLAVLALSFGDAVIKWVISDFSLWQLFVLRSLPAAVFLIGFIAWSKRTTFAPRSPLWVALRSFSLCFAWVLYYISLPHLKLSVAAACYYTGPLFIALFSALFTGARVSGRAWFALALGFAGVLALVRPDAAGFNIYALLPLTSGVFFALAMVLTATKCRRETPAVLALWVNFSFLIIGAAASLAVVALAPPGAAESLPLGAWTPPAARQWLAIGALAVVMVAAPMLVSVAYQKGQAPTIATFDYAYLAFSAMWGFLLFTEIPDALAVTGMVMITTAGVIAVRRI